MAAIRNLCLAFALTTVINMLQVLGIYGPRLKIYGACEVCI